MSLARRQRSVLSEPARELIGHVTGFEPGTDYFDICSSYVSLHLFDVNGMGGVRNKALDHSAIDSRIAGLAEKIYLNGHSSKAEALLGYLRRLRRLARSLGGGDAARMITDGTEMEKEEAAQNVVSSVLHVLLEVSEAPITLKRGERMYTVPDSLKETTTKPKSQDQINREAWMKILKEDPLTGDHWQINAGLGQQDNDGSDFEDMEVNPRAVPTKKDILLGREAKNDSTGLIEDEQPLCGLELWREQPYQSTRAAVDLKVLKRQQYWMDKSIIPKKGADVTRIDEPGLDIQRSCDLSSALQGYSLAQTFPMMDEADIIHEVLLVLQGLPTVIFTFDERLSKITYTTKVTLSHLSPGALETALKPFLESAEEIIKLQTVVDTICSASTKAYGKIIQAFASAINSEILELRIALSNKQKEFQRYRRGEMAKSTSKHHVASLIELQAELVERLTTVKTILQFVESCLFYIYSSIIVKDSSSCINSDNRFNVSAPNLDLFANEFWTDGCYVQTEIVEQSYNDKNSKMSTIQISPCFINDRTLSQLLYTGKAIRIIQALLASEIIAIPKAEDFASVTFTRIFGKDFVYGSSVATPTSAFSMDKEFPSYAPILAYQYPLSSSSSSVSSTHVIESATSPIEYTNAFDFQWRMETELAKSIEEQYQSANSLLKSALFTQSNLLWHLNGMAEFNFMMQGEVMHLFSTTIFDKMLKRRPWYDGYILGSTFSQTASLCDWKHDKFVRVRMNSQARNKSDRIHILGLKVQELELIEFEYLLPWPLSGIIYSTDNSKRMYSRITSLLFQVKTVKHAMEQAMFLKSKVKQSAELRLFWKLRIKFFSTINDIWSYLMTTERNSQVQQPQENLRGGLTENRKIDKTGRRVSFNNASHKHQQQLQGSVARAYRKSRDTYGTIDIDSEDETFEDQERDAEEDREGMFSINAVNKRRRGTQALSLENESSNDDMDDDEDIEMDSSKVIKDRLKKQKIDSDLWQGTGRDERWSHEGSYSEQLKAIEQEFNRCREFLAKSLRIVVNSNMARGYADRSGAASNLSEGDSNYLDSLILALSS
ncbi:hypothetical protein BGZ49_008342 [Haplosporangium sp. Z 27]|nr:hypothetical protein BGZ49_008342 [Haplosporangium sp. Z 27]